MSPMGTHLLQGKMQSPQHFSIPSRFFSASFMSVLIWSIPSSMRSSCSVEKGARVGSRRGTSPPFNGDQRFRSETTHLQSQHCKPRCPSRNEREGSRICGSGGRGHPNRRLPARDLSRHRARGVNWIPSPIKGVTRRTAKTWPE